MPKVDSNKLLQDWTPAEAERFLQKEGPARRAQPSYLGAELALYGGRPNFSVSCSTKSKADLVGGLFRRGTESGARDLSPRPSFLERWRRLIL